MKARTIAALSAATLAVTAVAALPHTVAPGVTCNGVELRYSANGLGVQRATETVTIDGATVYGPAQRVWQTNTAADVATYRIPVAVPGGQHRVGWAVSFTGSDGYRYSRSGSTLVRCDSPPDTTPTAPAPPNNPAPPATPPVVVTPQPATPAPPVATPRKPRRTVKRTTRTTRGSLCYRGRVKPRNAVGYRTTPRVGQIRVKWDRGSRTWIGFRGERHRITTIRTTTGSRVKITRRVRFIPGRYCGPVETRRYAG